MTHMQTAAALPQYRDADHGTLLGLYRHPGGHPGEGHADAFLVTGGLAVVAGAARADLLKKPPRRRPRPPSRPSPPTPLRGRGPAWSAPGARHGESRRARELPPADLTGVGIMCAAQAL